MSKEHDLGQLPKVHPRAGIVNKADLEFSKFVGEWAAKHGLTMAERHSIICRYVTRDMEWLVSIERRDAGE